MLNKLKNAILKCISLFQNQDIELTDYIEKVTDEDIDLWMFREIKLKKYQQLKDDDLKEERERLKLKLYSNEIKDTAADTKRISSMFSTFGTGVAIFLSIYAILLSINGEKTNLISFDDIMAFFIITVGIIIIVMVISGRTCKDRISEQKRINTCIQCKAAIQCIDDILKERGFTL